jgi:hypothetical protein
VHTYGLANCKFNPATLTTFVESVRWDTAVVNSLTLDSTGDMWDMKTYTLTASEEKVDLGQKNLGSADVALLTAWLQRPEVMAAVERVTLKSNRITGSKRVNGIWKYDLDMSGFTTFCEALPAAQTLRFLDLSECGLSVKAVNEIAKAVSAGAALTVVDVRGNMGLDIAAVDALRAAAPETCKILAD